MMLSFPCSAVQSENIGLDRGHTGESREQCDSPGLDDTRRASRSLKAFDMIAEGHDMFVKCLPDKDPIVQIRDM